ncbi:MAG: NAD-dependent epimerase/dehydratase family protein [bacterium]
MTVLITGCAGFIGSHLSEALIKKGHRVIGIDSFIPNYNRRIKERNLIDVLTNKNFSFYERSLLDSGWDDGLDFKCVVHFAALPGVRQSWGDIFSDYIENNILATQRLLEVLKKRGVIRLIHISSSSVYGDRDRAPLTEDLPPEPISPYAITKEVGERLVLLYSKQFGLDYVILRLFTVYGPRQRPDMAIYRFIESINKGENVEIYSKDNMYRDFTYVEDIVSGIMSAFESDLSCEIINLGFGKNKSIEDVVRIISDILDCNLNITRSDRKPGDVKSTLASIDKARQLLGYQPRFDIYEGIERQIEWMRGMSIIK